MSDKIPDHIIIKDLLQIKGENESYISELEHKVRDFENNDPHKRKYKKLTGELNVVIRKKNKLIEELRADMVYVKKSNEILRNKQQ